jgi:hypothetical protein
MGTAYSTNPIINSMPQTHDANGFVRSGSLRRRRASRVAEAGRV